MIINENENEVFTISLKAKSISEMKYHKLDFKFRVERDFSKQHGVLAMEIK